MSREANLLKVKSALADQLAIDPETVSENTSFIRDLGCDSLEYLQLVTALEDGLGTTFSDEEMQGVRTVADVLDIIETREMETRS